MSVETKIPLVDLALQYLSLKGEIDEAIQQVLTRTDFILGSALASFENEFAFFIQTEHAVGVASGLDALRLTLQALGVQPQDEVIVPAYTFISTALAVSHLGAKPVLVDCVPSTYTLDPAGFEAAITKRTRAVIPVHFAGQPVEMDPILKAAQRHGFSVIEDVAQAHGAEYHGKLCGSMGVAGCFSFYPAKNLGAYGDGGMVTTGQAALANRLRQLRHIGQSAPSEHLEKGFNSRLDTLQAAVLNVKLRHLKAWNRARQTHAEHYRSLLKGVGDLRFQASLPDSSHVYHLFLIETDHRDALKVHLQGAGIQSAIHYTRPVHLQPAYQDLGYGPGDFPHAEQLAKRTLCLPMFPELTDDQIGRIANEIRQFFKSVR